MTLDQIITLFKDMESGKEGRLVGFHLHHGIRQAMGLDWFTNNRRDSKFSDFLEALRDEESNRVA